MIFSLQHDHYPSILSTPSLRRTLISASAKEHDVIRRRRRALRKVDTQLWKGNFKNALFLVKNLQGRHGGLRGFGAAKQVPQRIMSLDELNLSEMEISYIQSLINSIMDSVHSSIQNSNTEHVPKKKSKRLTDGEALDSYSKESLMCLQHEAGHFLMGYLLGVLPKDYSVFTEEVIGGRVEFPSFKFLDEVDIEKRRKYKLSKRANMRKISLTNLNRFLCVILGGLAAEHLEFGYAEGFQTDVEKMEDVLRWLDFTEEEAESQVRWATLNTILILRRHEEARFRLAEAMGLGKSVGFCIETIENHLNENEINLF